MRISRRKLIQTGAYAGLERTQWLFREMFAEGQTQVGGLIPGRFIHTGHLSAQQIVAKDFRTAANVGETGGPAGIRFTASEIAGFSSDGTKQFYLQSSDGKALFGAGACIADSSGLTVVGQFLTFEDPADTAIGYLYAVAGTAALTMETASGYDIMIQAPHANDQIFIEAGTADTGGLIKINALKRDTDTIIAGENETDLIHVDASTDKVGFGIAAPAERVNIHNGNLKLTGTGATVKAAGYEIADGNAGADGSFTAGSGETVTVEKGIITGIV